MNEYNITAELASLKTVSTTNITGSSQHGVAAVLAGPTLAFAPAGRVIYLLVIRTYLIYTIFFFSFCGIYKFFFSYFK